jgi:hypothetical protein
MTYTLYLQKRKKYALLYHVFPTTCANDHYRNKEWIPTSLLCESWRSYLRSQNLTFVTFDSIKRWCINDCYFKNISYSHVMIRLKEILLGKRVNSDLIDMSTKEKIILVLHLLLVFTSRDHITWINLIWFRILVIVRMD